MFIKNLFWLGVALVFTGCTTISNYNAKAPAGPARAKDYPIHLYPKEVNVPRPHEVVGIMTIRDTPLTVWGGSFEGEVAELRRKAQKVGADAVKLTSVEQPDFLHAKYRVDGEIIRYTDVWEKSELTEANFKAYLAANAAALDPVEGIWQANDLMQTRVGIVRNASKPGRDFVAFILGTANASWQPGYKKLELASGERAGVYRGLFYYEDFRRRGIAITLRGQAPVIFIIPMEGDTPPVIFAKE